MPQTPTLPKRRPPRAGLGPGPHKTTKTLKTAILEAATRLGNDGKGKDGLVGYCMALGKEEPKAFAALLGRVLPMQVTGEGGGPIRMVDESMTPREAAEAYAETLRNIAGIGGEIDEGIEVTLGPDEYTSEDGLEGDPE